MANPLLLVKQVTKSFGGLQALQHVSLEIYPGQIVGLIGPNGAGKTTFFNIITGLYQADAGEFFFNAKAYDPTAIDQVLRLGIARTFQNIRLFTSMTVLENVMVGLHSQTRASLFGTFFQTRAASTEESYVRRKAHELLNYVGIEAYAEQLASSLSYGYQRKLEIARALGSAPKLLALDEPAAGMNTVEKNDLVALIRRINQDGVTIVIIEHDVKFMMSICDQITVLNHGEVIAKGEPKEIVANKAVVEAYLGAELDL